MDIPDKYLVINQPLKPGTPPLKSTRLLDQMRERIRYMHYSLSTERIYLYWVRFFIHWHGRGEQMQHPRSIGAHGIEAFLPCLLPNTRCLVSNTGMTTSAAPAILEVKRLGFRYPERTLFSNWSASLSLGVTLVLGGDGRGKTTLLRLLAGDLTAGAG